MVIFHGYVNLPEGISIVNGIITHKNHWDHHTLVTVNHGYLQVGPPNSIAFANGLQGHVTVIQYTIVISSINCHKLP